MLVPVVSLSPSGAAKAVDGAVLAASLIALTLATAGRS